MIRRTLLVVLVGFALTVPAVADEPELGARPQCPAPPFQLTADDGPPVFLGAAETWKCFADWQCQDGRIEPGEGREEAEQLTKDAACRESLQKAEEAGREACRAGNPSGVYITEAARNCNTCFIPD